MHREPEQSRRPDQQTVAETLGRYVSGLEAKMQAIPVPDDPLGEAGRKYDALIAWYDKHIAHARAQLKAIRQ
jgi:hypothetical protein